MTKDELIGMFHTAHNNCKLVYASIVLFSHDEIASFYENWSNSLNIPQPYDEKELLLILNNRTILKHAYNQLYDSVHRSALVELFEMTKAYCKETKQEEILTRQSWYQFWRILRNCFSHSFKFEFREYDKKQLPVSWSNITLDISLEGKNLTHGTLSREDLLKFLDEIKKFIEKNLR